MEGFQTVLYPPFELVLNQTARLDFQMQLGVINQTVEVQGAAPMLSTDSMQLGAVIERQPVSCLPLATRNYIQLTLLVQDHFIPILQPSPVEPASFRADRT